MDGTPDTLVPAPVAEAAPTPLAEVPVEDRLAFAMIEQIALGRSLDEAASLPGLPSKDQFLVWVMRTPNLAYAVEQARKISAFAMEDEALARLRALADARTPPSPGSLKAADLLVDQLRWSATKRNPAIYSDRAAVAVTVPIQINTSLDLGRQRLDGTAEHPNIYELKAEHMVEVPKEPGEPPPPVHDDRRVVESDEARKKRLKREAKKRWIKNSPAQQAKQKARLQMLKAKAKENKSRNSTGQAGDPC